MPELYHMKLFPIPELSCTNQAYIITENGTSVEKVGAPGGNPTLVAGIDPMHHVILPKVPNFPEISEATSAFHGNLAI